MKSCWILFLCLSCLWASGCCGLRQRQISALEQENSQLNGLLWEMEFEVQSLKEENQRLQERLASEDDHQEEPAPRRSVAPEKRTEPAQPAPFDPDSFRPPVIEFPSEPSPEGTVPKSLLPTPSAEPLSPQPDHSTSRRSRSPVASASHQEPAPPEPKIEVVPPEEISFDSSRIKRIALGPMIGTLHLDNKPGDDGLVIVVEPWDDTGRMLAEAADIAVVLIDPAEPKETARYAQWQFDTREAAKLFRDGDVPGLHLELPWPGDPPRHDRLHLFVRYTTTDGRKLEADTMVEIDLQGPGRWVASDTPQVRPSEQPILPGKPTPLPPAAPQIVSADPKPATERPANVVRTVSMASGSPQSDRQSETDRATPKSEPGRQIAYGETRPLPLPRPSREPSPEKEPPGRERPVWSPDRPW